MTLVLVHGQNTQKVFNYFIYLHDLDTLTLKCNLDIVANYTHVCQQQSHKAKWSKSYHTETRSYNVSTVNGPTSITRLLKL